MQLGEKIKAARKAAKMTQPELAKAIGVSTRTVQFYEANQRAPRNATAIIRIAEILKVKTDYFLSDVELEKVQAQNAFLDGAQKQYGTRGKVQAKHILEQASALFDGGGLNEADQETFFETMTEIYFDAKKKAKKYVPKNTGEKQE